MAMTSKDDPIPEDVRKAFDLAAKALFAWSAIGGDEPTVVVHGSPSSSAPSPLSLNPIMI
jgi:hypothetical protein